MDESKLNKFALSMAKDIMEVKRSLPLSGAIGAVNYKLSNIASQMHLFVDTMEGFGETPAGIYALTLMVSGAGKGASLTLLDRIYCEEAFTKIRDTVYPLYKNKAIQRITDMGMEEPLLRSWTQRVETATMSGVSAIAESYYTVGFGGVNIEMDEVADSIISEKELFDKLLKTYDNGDYPATAKRTDPNPMDIKKMPTNLYCFGNKVKLTDGGSVQNEFMNMLDKGYARRMIFVDDNSVNVPRTPEEVLEDMDKGQDIYAKRKTEREYIASLITTANFKKTMTLDREARLFMATIRSEGENYVSYNPKLEQAIQSDMIERAFKTAKLACVYAFFDGNTAVTKKNMEEAFEVVKSSSEVLQVLRKVKPLEEMILDSLLKESKPVTSQTILSYPFVNKSWTKKIIEYISLAKELASERGYEWDEHTKGGVVYYTVSKTQTERELF